MIEPGVGLRQAAVGGVAWTAVAQFGRQILHLTLSIGLARLLTPNDFGLISMVLVFTGFAALFGDLGFGAALIQRPTVEERHRSSVFWLNLASGLVLMAAMILAAPLVGSFYNEPRLVPLTRLIALNFPIASLGIVQSALLRREMRFRFVALADIVAVSVSGAVAITLALAGTGVWSLAWQTLVASAVTAAVLMKFGDWRPHLAFDSTAVRELVRFSSNLMGFNLLNYWVRNADNVLVGKYIGEQGLGIYGRAYSVLLMPVNQIAGALGQVMFPALSRVQADKARVARIYLRTLGMIALITFPMMGLLLVAADHFVMALLGPRWLAVVPILRIFCLLGMVQSLATTTGWIFQSQGRTDWFLRWGAGAGVVMIASIALGVRIGTVESVAACYAVASGLVLLYPAFAIPGRLIGMTFRDVVNAIAPVAACAATASVAGWCVGHVLPSRWPDWVFLALQCALGGAVYLALIHSGRIRPYRDARALLSEQWRLYRAPKPVADTSYTGGAP